MTDEEKQWVEAWKTAGPKLQAIRDEELRQTRGKGFQPIDGGTVVYDAAPLSNGLVVMQAWFTRFQVLLNTPVPPEIRGRPESTL